MVWEAFRPQAHEGRFARLSFFLPGLGFTNDLQALGPPDHFWIY